MKHRQLTTQKWKIKLSSAFGFLLGLVRLHCPRIYTFVARVYQGAAAFLVANSSAFSNNRSFAGLLLICVATPIAGVVYHLFDSTVVIEGWYYSNFFWLFYVIGPHLQMLLTLTGIFLILPEDVKQSHFLAIPAGYHVAKIIWYAQVSSDAEIREVMPFTFLLVGLLIGYAWLRTSNYMVTLHFHRILGPLSTAQGLVDCPDMSDSEKIMNLRPKLAQLRARLTGQGPTNR